jgi:hypothetical protein
VEEKIFATHDADFVGRVTVISAARAGEKLLADFTVDFPVPTVDS